MALKGRMSVEKEIKCHGDVFHDLFKQNPHHISNIAPNHVHSCDVHEGELGTVGSVISWEYTHEGKKKTIKVVIEAIDEEKKLVKFKGIEGDILEMYKEYSATIHVDTKGDNHVVTWTLDYVKAREDVPDPTSILELALKVTDDIEAHHAPTK